MTTAGATWFGPRALAWCAVGLLVSCASLAAQGAEPVTRASGTAFAAIYGTGFQTGNLTGRPWGIAGGATASNGAGVGARWGIADDLHYWSVGFLQVVPSIRGAKSVQPFMSLALCGAHRAGERATCLEAGGGVVAFLGRRVGLGVDLRYLHGLTRLGDDRLRERHVSGALLWRF